MDLSVGRLRAFCGIPHGPQQDAGLQQIRDTLPPAPVPRTVEPAPRPVSEEVPPEGWRW
ncbi:hypothetical protein ACF08B_40785 [Streptomyces sp. NPDC015139]|uniref:hypothetical protein n=1 Tax=Streptomyces sp. NPDC015139 TaxID=3364942 RepID=UPI00370145BC